MTEQERNAEIGRTLREYKEQSERMGCLLSKLARIAEEAEKVRKAAPDPAALAQTAQTAAQRVGEGDVTALLRSIAEAGATKQRLWELLHRQGVGEMLRDQRQG